jgi:threonine dehydrogenase-like Zn-dependent dehydrogenase
MDLRVLARFLNYRGRINMVQVANKKISLPKNGATETEEYQLIRPLTILKIRKKATFSAGDHVFRPILAGICGSDLSYFKGDKDPRKLYTRLPITLLHEGVVRSVETGKLGCVIPFVNCGNCYACLNNMEHLCENSLYMGSNAPGLSRSQFAYPKDLIIELPDDFPVKIAAIIEPMSIVYRMVNEINLNKDDKIAVIGSGLLGLLTIIFLSKLRHVGKENLCLVGRSNKKLEKMSDICETVNISQLAHSFKSSFSMVVEAVGGHSMGYSLSLSVKVCRPSGQINIFGLSDCINHVNFTDITKKGLRLTGFSRAKVSDYVELIEIIKNDDRQLANYIYRTIDSKEIVIKSETDLNDAFHYAMSGNNEGRVLVAFEEGL